ncbi:hypothetical protein KOW79_006714 [Hemibagrus wyckioides]|uniref:Uncharacterized protein n=1 Tax=Hemibagrus wyckioides TaxID=337641 RepID=A0A9D3NXW8_9TELE|nr:hypothetical protein KOW79_006714 [Hemibagrus wyckioides]
MVLLRIFWLMTEMSTRFKALDFGMSWKGREAELRVGRISHIPHRSPAKQKSRERRRKKQAQKVSLN